MDALRPLWYVLAALSIIALCALGFGAGRLAYVPRADAQEEERPLPEASSSPARAPRAALSPSAPEDTKMRTLHIQDNGGFLILSRGETFALSLGDYDWTFSPSQPGILAPLSPFRFEAQGEGTTTLRATGVPRCPGALYCPQYFILFSLRVVVR